MKTYLYVASHEGMYLLEVARILQADSGYKSEGGWAMSALYRLCKLGFLTKREDRERDELEGQNEKQRGRHSKNIMRVYINW